MNFGGTWLSWKRKKKEKISVLKLTQLFPLVSQSVQSVHGYFCTYEASVWKGILVRRVYQKKKKRNAYSKVVVYNWGAWIEIPLLKQAMTRNYRARSVGYWILTPKLLCPYSATHGLKAGPEVAQQPFNRSGGGIILVAKGREVMQDRASISQSKDGCGERFSMRWGRVLDNFVKETGFHKGIWTFGLDKLI